MRKRLGLVLSACILGVSGSATAARPAQQNAALGLIARVSGGQIGDASASEGSTVYSGDSLSTNDNGSMLVRVGAMSLELQNSTAVHIYRTPYGAIAELNRGTVLYTTPGGAQNLIIVVSDIRVTPDLSNADAGRVSLDDPCDATVYTQKGQATVVVGSENRVVEQGKAYRVRALNEINYRKYLSPDDSDYHNYHEHVTCPAAYDMAKGKLPVAGGKSAFLLIAAGTTGVATGILIWKALESPDHP